MAAPIVFVRSIALVKLIQTLFPFEPASIVEITERRENLITPAFLFVARRHLLYSRARDGTDDGDTVDSPDDHRIKRVRSLSSVDENLVVLSGFLLEDVQPGSLFITKYEAVRATRRDDLKLPESGFYIPCWHGVKVGRGDARLPANECQIFNKVE